MVYVILVRCVCTGECRYKRGYLQFLMVIDCYSSVQKRGRVVVPISGVDTAIPNDVIEYYSTAANITVDLFALWRVQGMRSTVHRKLDASLRVHCCGSIVVGPLLLVHCCWSIVVGPLLWVHCCWLAEVNPPTGSLTYKGELRRSYTRSLDVG